MRLAACMLLIAIVAPKLLAEAPPPTSQPAVTREEYERLRQEVEELRRHAASAPAAEHDGAAHSDDLEQQLQELRDQVHSALPGTEHLLIAGDAAVGFVNRPKSNSTFTAGVSPLFLWEPTDRLLFEAAFDVGIATDADANSSTSFDLTIADASFIVNDYLIVGGGLFVLPFGQYHNHFDPPWINKLPDDPLVFSDGGIAPGSEVGIFGRGAVPLGSMKLTYDGYLTNGPNLITKDPAAAGSLNFKDFTDLNNGKALGGRIALLPVPNLEFGYSIEYAQVSPSSFGHDVYATLQAADFNWVQEIRPIAGVLTLRGDWVWSDVSRTTYDRNRTLGFGPISFSNYRDGGYALIAYRPTLLPNRYLKNVEFVFRYDMQRTPLSSPGGEHEQRYEFGIDYWLTPSAVLKVAYEIDDRKVGPNQDAFYVQFGIGL